LALAKFARLLGVGIIAVFLVNLAVVGVSGSAWGMTLSDGDGDDPPVLPPIPGPGSSSGGSGSLDWVDSSTSGPSSVDENGVMLDIKTICSDYAVGTEDFDFTVSQDAYLRCMLQYNTTYTRVFAGMTLKYIYFVARFNVLLDKDADYVKIGQPDNQQRMFWLTDARGCVVSSDPVKTWEATKAAYRQGLSCPYPAIPSGTSFPVPISNGIFWAMIMRDMYNQGIAAEAQKDGYGSAQAWLEDVYENGAPIDGTGGVPGGGTRVMYNEYKAFSYKYTVEKVRASCGGLFLPNAYPFGCEYIRNHYQTRFEAWNSPPDFGSYISGPSGQASILSGLELAVGTSGGLTYYDPEPEVLYKYDTDLHGTVVTYTVQQARPVACYVECTMASRYGSGCEYETIDHGCQPTWSPPGTVYNDQYGFYWGGITTINEYGTYEHHGDGGWVEYQSGPKLTLLAVAKWHYTACVVEEWNPIQYDGACPTSDGHINQVYYQPMTDAEWSLISGYLDELAAAGNKGAMALFIVYTNAYNGYMNAERLNAFKSYIASGNPTLFPKNCIYCPEVCIGGDPLDPTGGGCAPFQGSYNSFTTLLQNSGYDNGLLYELQRHVPGCVQLTSANMWSSTPSVLRPNICEILELTFTRSFCIGAGTCFIDDTKCNNPVPPGVRSNWPFAQNVQRGTDRPGYPGYSLINRLMGVTPLDYGGAFCGMSTSGPTLFVCEAPPSGIMIPLLESALFPVGASGSLWIDDLWLIALAIGAAMIIVTARRGRRRRQRSWRVS